MRAPRGEHRRRQQSFIPPNLKRGMSMENAIQLQERENALAQTISAEDVLEAYLAELDRTEKTKDTYRRALRQFMRYLERGGIPADRVTRAHVLEYKRSLEEHKSAATTNAYLVAVRSFYAWINARTGYPNVAENVRGVKRQNAIGHDALTLEQSRDLLSLEGDTLKDKRNRALISLMLRRGLRTIEISRADIGDLRQTAGKPVLYVQGKGHGAKDDFVVLSEDVLEPLRDYLSARGEYSDAAPLFAATGNRNAGGRLTTRAISRIVKDALRDIGIVDPHITAHSLRHTAVTLALEAGASVQEAQAMARHARIDTTMIYAHNLDRMAANAERSIDSYLAGTREGTQTP